MRGLAIYTGLNAALFAGYHWVNPFPDHIVNRVVATEIAAVSVLCVVIPLSFTKHWRPLSLGLLGLFTGLAMIYVMVALDGTPFAIRATPPPALVTTPRWYTELFRILLATGGAYVAYWLIRWAWTRRDEAFPWLRDTVGGDPFEPEDEA